MSAFCHNRNPHCCIDLKFMNRFSVKLPSLRVQQGFTLIELMVSLLLGLLITAALITIYVNISRTNTEMIKTNTLIENGRFAIDILQEDISHAGFWGGYVAQFDDLTSSATPADTPTLLPDPCLSYSNWVTTSGYKNSLIGIPIQTYDASPPGCAAIVTDKQANTDVLVVRHAEVCLPGVGNCESNNASKVYFQSSYCENEYSATPPLRYVLSNTATDFALKKRGCIGTPPAATVGTVSDKRKFIANLYYVRTYAVTVGDGIPTLMRSNFDIVNGMPAFGTATALIEGIEGFRVELGFDGQSRCNTNTDYTTAVSKVNPTTCLVSATTTENTMPINRGDGVPEGPFRHCNSTSSTFPEVNCTYGLLTNTVAVKLYVLTRSRETALGQLDAKQYTLGGATLGPFNDRYKRHVFQSMVRLTNISGRRETP